MKRLILSLLGGFLIPFLYAITVGPLTPYIQDQRLNQLANLPVRWPVMILEYTFPLWWTWLSWEQGQQIWLLVYIIICNVVLYSLVTYVLLRVFWKPQPKPSPSPPDPPDFEST